MNNLAQYLPEIIKESATSPLGIFALMIIVLAFLGFSFFGKRTTERTRVIIFAMMFSGVLAFGAVVVQQSKIVSEKHETGTAIDRHATNAKEPLALAPPQQSEPSLRHLTATGQANSADAIYKILDGRVEQYSADKLKLQLTVRLTNNGSESVLFSDNRFRLDVDGDPLAPSDTSITDWVVHDSSKVGEVIFIVPITATNLELRVGNPGMWGKIPIRLN